MRLGILKRLILLATPPFWGSLAFSAVAPVQYKFVSADVVNVRKAPQPGAPVVAKLRINTQVEVLADVKGFSRIRFKIPPGTVEGFVSQTTLGSEPVSFEAALKQANDLAATPERRAEARSWAERAVAIDGSSDRALEALAKLLDDKGSIRARDHIGEVLAGKASAWIALCRDKPEGAFPRASRYRVELLFRLDAGGKIVPVLDSNGGSPGTPAAYVVDLSSAQWFLLDAHGSRQVEGSPFALARTVDAWNEAREGSPPDPSGGGSGGRVVLGACSQAGAIYSTQPIRALDLASGPTSGAWDFTRAVSALSPNLVSPEDGFQGRVEAVEGQTFEGLAELRLKLAGVAKANEACEGGRMEAQVWGVVTMAGQVLARLGGLGAADSISVTDQARFQLKRGDGARVFFGLATRWTCEKGINYVGQVLWLPASGDPVKADLSLGGEGC